MAVWNEGANWRGSSKGKCAVVQADMLLEQQAAFNLNFSTVLLLFCASVATACIK
jgi:hypothetical protein